RPGHLADERTAGAQDGAIAQGFARAIGHDERRHRWRGGAVPGLRQFAPLPAAEPHLPLYQGHALPERALRTRRPEGISEVFLKPPVSPQQILHPEKYFSGVKPTEPDLPQPHLPKGYKSLVGGSLGELEHAIMLEQYSGKERAAELAPHWRGCAFDLEENKKAGRIVLLYAVEWDSEDAGRQYFAAYRAQLAKKGKQMTVATETADAVTGTGDDGRFELRRKGAVVTSM